MIHQDCYNKYYTVNYFNDHIEIETNFIPKYNYDKSKIYFDLVVFYTIDKIIIKYNSKISQMYKLKNIFHSQQNIHLNLHNNKNIKLFQ